MTKPIDPYSASIFESSDCDREIYRTKKLPKGCNLINAYKLFREIPMWSLHKTGKKFAKEPSKAKEEYLKIVEKDANALDRLATDRELGSHTGTLKQYSQDLCDAMKDSLTEELGAVFSGGIMKTFKVLDEKRRDESLPKEVRDEYEHLCGGYAGDIIMEINIAIFKLARKLPLDVWNRYDHDSMNELSDRIQRNLNALNNPSDENCDLPVTDLPIDFLISWTSFMDQFGYDGQDQLFLSCPRYQDRPELLLSKMRMNALAGDSMKDPKQIQQEQVDKRRDQQ